MKSDLHPKGNGLNRLKAWRLVVFAARALALAAADSVLAPRSDPKARAGGGYNHTATRLDPATPGFGTLRGPSRVEFNFRHFAHWWMWPLTGPERWRLFLAGDGNSMASNLA